MGQISLPDHANGCYKSDKLKTKELGLRNYFLLFFWPLVSRSFFVIIPFIIQIFS